MVFAQWFWVFFKTSHITRTTKSLLLHQQYCDDYQLKGRVAQTSEGLNSGVLHLRPIRVAALRNALGHCGTLCGTLEPSTLCKKVIGFHWPARAASSSDCDCNPSQKATSFSGCAKRRSAVSHTDLHQNNHQTLLQILSAQAIHCMYWGWAMCI